eukprot:6013969-Pyramimonas_sp.AAC.1
MHDAHEADAPRQGTGAKREPPRGEGGAQPCRARPPPWRTTSWAPPGRGSRCRSSPGRAGCRAARARCPGG